MRRYWIPADAIENGVVAISGDEFHHIVGVCRNGVGMKFEVLTGDDVARLVELVEVGKKAAQLLPLADKYGVPLLEKFCLASIKQNLKPENAIETWLAAKQNECKELEISAISCIKNNPRLLTEAQHDIKKFPADLIVDIMSIPYRVM